MHPGTRVRATRITEPQPVLATAVSAWFVLAVIAIAVAAYIPRMIWGMTRQNDNRLVQRLSGLLFPKGRPAARHAPPR
jgi:hypothetical protein